MPNIFCLLFVLGHVVADVPSQRERLDLLGFLVRLRKDVSPPASNMNLLVSFDPILEFTMGITSSYESRNYDYDSNSCRGTCRNYKLMVWAATTEVGCAKHQCFSKKDTMDRKSILACVFNNVDNALIERPYEMGESCSNCHGESDCLYNQCHQRVSSTQGNCTSTSITMTKTLPNTFTSTPSSQTHTTTTDSAVTPMETTNF
uniref:SCP domain-containing protein n=1 Tax=Mesocestoides corti TaxID=53468 RepID=A0A5K3FFB6_MESCO